MKCIRPVFKYGQMFGCGRCYFCQQKKRSELYCRLKIEQYYSFYSLFVTLTYAPEFMPPEGYVNRRDVQLYLKRLRKHYPPRCIRYMVTAEYGGHTSRCHYHLLLFFNEKLQDVSPLFDCWNKGFVTIGEVTEGRIMYMSKYCHKILREDEGFGEKGKTFRLFSRGLGIDFLTDTPQVEQMLQRLDFSKLHFMGETFTTPRYYRDKLKKSLSGTRLEEYNFRIQQEANKVMLEYREKYYSSPDSPKNLRNLEELEDEKISSIVKHYRHRKNG